jgi:hypothetical protein
MEIVVVSSGFAEDCVELAIVVIGVSSCLLLEDLTPRPRADGWRKGGACAGIDAA